MSAGSGPKSGAGSGWGSSGSGSALRAVEGPLGDLPRLARRQARLSMRLSRDGRSLGGLRDWLGELLGESPRIGHAEVQWRASGLKRPGAIAHLAWPRLSTRIGLGIEPSIAHSLVDHLLGFQRSEGESRLQVTPVEWGVLSFLLARGLCELDQSAGPIGPWDLVLERVGPELFSIDGLGAVATLSWPIRIGTTSGTIRLWVPKLVIALLLIDDSAADGSISIDQLTGRFASFGQDWRVEGGLTSLPRGLSRLRAGAVLPIDGSSLGGSPAAPEGSISLVLHCRGSRYFMPVEAMPGSGGGRIRVVDYPRREIVPEEISVMSTAPENGPEASDRAGLLPAEVPVTLVIELGRLNLPLGRLADLRPGDVLELSRHAREPVELTCGGKLVARGELVQIDTELGVRVLSVFL